MVGFRGGGWHSAGHRANLAVVFQEFERRSATVGLLTANGGMQGLKGVLYTVVLDALQEPIEAEVAARFSAGRWERATAARCATVHGLVVLSRRVVYAGLKGEAVSVWNRGVRSHRAQETAS